MHRRRITIAALIGAAGVGALFLALDRTPAPSGEQLILRARVALKEQKYSEALALASTGRAAGGELSSAIEVEVQAAFHLGKFDEALALADLAPAGDSRGLAARFFAADVAFDRGRFASAERRFRDVLAADPNHAEANRRLSALLIAQNRNWESLPYLLALVRLRKFAAVDLKLLSVPDVPKTNERLLRQALEFAPDEVLPLLGMVAKFTEEGNFAAAKENLDRVLSAFPDLAEAHARWGQLLYKHRPAEFAGWEASLPAAASMHPDVWRLRGQAAEARGALNVAMRCYWEALKRHPNQQVACARLAELLSLQGRQAEAETLQLRAARLDALARTIRDLQYDEVSFEQAIDVARKMDALNRRWEAWAWRQLAIIRSNQIDVPSDALEAVRNEASQLADQLGPHSPLATLDIDEKLSQELASLPLPSTGPAPAEAVVPDEVPVILGDIRWVDRAGDAGIDFTVNNGDDMSVPGMQIFNELGGGVAALDFDVDGLPDLYVSQGCDWPPAAGNATDLDRLYRNLGDGRAAEVSANAGIIEAEFSQGATFGDYNADGFPDLYVANIGRNRLFRNNGDGTFTDVSLAAALATEFRWSTSVLLADFSGDGLPDLYDATYIAGQQCYTQICPTGSEVRACRPNLFPADQDRFYLNLGDGTFKDVSEAAGIFAPEGRGLGLLAATLNGRLSLFVANDMTPNFFFRIEPAAGETPRFSETAPIANLAGDRNGQSQACMGVAAGDFDGNGRFDLFVTNFYLEANALYSQHRPGAFSDIIRPSGMEQSSVPMLGFGVQAVDADLDGWLDLAVANGHVDDFSFRGEPYKMRPQFFRNAGRGKKRWLGFSELSNDQLGPYFAERCLGRAMGRIDWNHDRRDDLAVLHLDRPLALLLNESTSTGRAITLRLVGVLSPREPIGAVVRVESSAGEHTYQLFGGDGFHAANERKLSIGVGPATKVDRLSIEWPSGKSQTFTDVSSDADYIAIEGREALARGN